MADPYWRHPSAERDPRTDPRAAFPGYLPSNGSSITSNQMWSAGDPRGTSDFLRSDVLPIQSGNYGSDALAGVGIHATPGLSSLAAGGSVRGYTPLEDPALARRDALGMTPSITDISKDPLIRSDGPSADHSNVLFVDGLPTDCTRREVAHLFRPFIGFKDIKVVHKEPRRHFFDPMSISFSTAHSIQYHLCRPCFGTSPDGGQTGDKAYVLCFVEFDEAKNALTALQALQEYKFDHKKPDSPVLRIQFAKFPFHPSSVRDDQRHGSAC